MTIKDDLNTYLDPILIAFRDRLHMRLNGYLAMVYLRGSAQMVQYGRTITTDRPILFEGPPVKDAIAYAEKRGAQLITQMDEETKERIAKIVSDAIAEKRGIPGLARDVRREIDDMSRTRARVIARTETADALEQAFMDRAGDLGVTGKEVVPGDPCEICRSFVEEGVVPIDYEFIYQGESYGPRPPFHPNAVFAESPFVSYGSLLQVVRSKYSGPARMIQTDRISFTIGPNHPILTRRGWVKASEVHEGDQLIYDSRTEYTRMEVGKPYFNQMFTIQDVFDSLLPMCGYATIASPRVYFHGDEVFTYGKVDVILPAGNLLAVLDAESIKEFSQFNFVKADANLPAVASISSSNNAVNRVGAAPSSIVGSFGLVEPFFGSQSLPPFFESVTVTHVENLHYDGWAYDASTSTGLYNSSGIVVKNCVCALAPVMIK